MVSNEAAAKVQLRCIEFQFVYWRM